MKAIWKVLLGAAAIAAVAPYRVEKDEETGEVKVSSVTWSATINRENGTNIDVKLLPLFNRKDECCCDDECCCCEEPETAPAGEAQEEGITIEAQETPAEDPAAPVDPEPTQA